MPPDGASPVIHPAEPAVHPRVAQAVQFLDIWLEAEKDYQQLPGLAVAVVHGQETVYSRGFGMADRERQLAATPGTIFSVCSISKLFTAIAVMQLRDEGRLRLDDPVVEHLPWFRLAGADPDDPPVTIGSLLTHSSGLPREADFPYWTGPEFRFPSRDEVLERLPDQAMLLPVDRHYQYSNLGPTLLGEVVAAVSGEPYDRYLARRVLGPIGLESTTPDLPLDERGQRLARGYSALRRGGGREPVPFFRARGIAPAAGFASTAEDLARFAKWQFQALQRGRQNEVLLGNTLREMQRVHFLDYEAEAVRGLGFGVWREGGRTFVGHGGSCPGYRSHLLIQPDEQVAVVALVNAQGVNASQMTQVIHGIMAPALRAARAETAPAPLGAPAALQAYAGVYDVGFASEMAVIPWEKDLLAVELPAQQPLRDGVRLRLTGDRAFRRVRKDGTLAETVGFSADAEGRVTGFTWHQNRFRRVR